MLLLACCCSCSFQMPRWSLHQKQTEKYVVRCDTKWQHVWCAAHTHSKINLQWKTKLEICHRGKTQNLSLSRNNSLLFLYHFKFRKKNNNQSWRKKRDKFLGVKDTACLVSYYSSCALVSFGGYFPRTAELDLKLFPSKPENTLAQNNVNGWCS